MEVFKSCGLWPQQIVKSSGYKTLFIRQKTTFHDTNMAIVSYLDILFQFMMLNDLMSTEVNGTGGVYQEQNDSCTRIQE